MKYYLLYKLTNKVNGKIYVGCHITKNLDDGYMGSGKRLAYAKKKYGLENFKKEILSVHETPEEMFAEEARIVNEEFVGRSDVYNLAIGGAGTWWHINHKDGWKGVPNWKNPEVAKKISAGRVRKFNNDPVFRAAYSKSLSEAGKRRIVNPFYGKTHSEFTKLQMRDSHKGKHVGAKNSRFGSCWITNGLEAKSIPLSDLQKWKDLGWIRGRKPQAHIRE